MNARDVWESRRPEIERLYFCEGYSQTSLAAYYNISQPAVVKLMRRLGITAKHQGRYSTEKQDRTFRPRFVAPALEVLATPGWWNPAPPRLVRPAKRVVKGMGL